MESFQQSSPFNPNGKKSIVQILESLQKTGFQGRTLGDAYHLLKEMLADKGVTVLWGYAGSLSVAGQSKIIQWLIDHEFIDVLVPTGANISEDIVESIGYNYYQGHPGLDNELLYQLGYNRYYDLLGREEEYHEMTQLIAAFIKTLDFDVNYSSRSFLNLFGAWLVQKNIDCIVSAAHKRKVPIFCPALADSPYGDAALLAKTDGFSLCIDGMKDYSEFMNLAKKVEGTAVVYLGGGVPKDFIQLFAVSPCLLDESFGASVKNGKRRSKTKEINFPHKYALQVTTDSPQWGGLSGCTFEEASSWGKEEQGGRNVQCYCDVTIALPLLVQGLVEEENLIKRAGKRLSQYF
jgi:deoxyhypusine synthase